MTTEISPTEIADAIVEVWGWEDANKVAAQSIEWAAGTPREQHWRDVAAIIRLMRVDDTTEDAPE